MKKHTSLLALGIILSSQILPIAAHANSVESNTGLSDAPPSSLITDINEVEKEPVVDTEYDESVDISEIDNSEEVTEELEDQEILSIQNPVASTENEVVSPDSIIETTWGTAKAEFDESTGTLTVHDGVISGGFRTADTPVDVHFNNIKHIIWGNDVSMGEDSSYLFQDYTYLNSIKGEINTKNVTNMQGMFVNCTSLIDIDTHSWDTSNVTNMEVMFANVPALTTIDVSLWNTSNVTNMRSVFSGASKLNNLDVTTWDTSNVTDMSSMFYGTTDLSNLNVTNWNISKLTVAASMFEKSGIQALNVSDWDTSSLTNTSRMFCSAKNLTNLDVKNWNTSRFENISEMFRVCTAITTLDVSSWDVSSVNNMYGTFAYMYSITSIDVSSWDMSSVTNISVLFSNSNNIIALDVKDWDVSNVVSFGEAFYGMTSLIKLDVSSWNTSSGTAMGMMFALTPNLKTIDVSKWDTSNVTVTQEMFYDSGVTLLDMSGWDSSKIGYYEESGHYNTSMFTKASSLSTIKLGENIRFNQDDSENFVRLPNIDTSSGEYTGRWIDEETGVTYESSDDFMKEYDGSTPGTYVWEKKLQSIDAKDTTIYVGDTWNPESNFISATNSQGNPVTFDKISVEGTVDTNTVGTYPIIYTYDGQSTTVNVTVVEGQESLVTKDSTIDVGTKWDAKDNFVSATDRDGNPLEISDITIEGTVDTSKAGEYQVVYTWNAKDEAGNPTGFTITSEATITVVGDGEEVTTDETDENDNKATLETRHNKSGNKSSSNLPNTGEQSSVISMTLGGLMLILAGGMALFGLKKIKKETK